jgi:hypothetical protein
MQEGIASSELRVKLLHGFSHQVRAADQMDRKALCHCEELVVLREHTTGEISGGVDDSRTPRANHRIAHRSDYALEAIGEYGKANTIETHMVTSRTRRRDGTIGIVRIHIFVWAGHKLPFYTSLSFAEG